MVLDHSRLELRKLADDGDDFLVSKAAPDTAQRVTTNILHQNVWGSGDVGRVGRVSVNLGKRGLTRPLVLDSGYLAGDGVAVWTVIG